VTLGENGLFVVRSTDSNLLFPLRGSSQRVGKTVQAEHFPANFDKQTEQRLVSVSGAGDWYAEIQNLNKFCIPFGQLFLCSRS